MNATKLNELYATYCTNPATEEQFFSGLLAFATDYCRVHHLPEDIAQDAMIKVWRNINAYRGDSAFSTWVTRILKNTTFEHYTVLSKMESVELTEEDLISECSPVFFWEYGEFTEREKTIIALLQQGCTQTEIARKLKVSQPVISLEIKSLRSAIKDASFPI